MSKPKKAFGTPQIVHSEKGEGFTNFFKEQCKKIERTHMRCKIDSHPIRITKEYADGYDLIDWKKNVDTKQSLTKNL